VIGLLGTNGTRIRDGNRDRSRDRNRDRGVQIGVRVGGVVSFVFGLEEVGGCGWFHLR